MGCIQSDLSWEEIEFDSDDDSSDFGTNRKSLNPTMFRKTRQSISSRLNLTKTTRKSLEIIEKFGNRDTSALDTVRKRISLSDAKNWSHPTNGFQALLNSYSGSRLFMEFLRHEYSNENLMFWLACERAKNASTDDEFLEQAKQIFQQFLTSHSPYEVSLDYRVRERVTNQMNTTNRNMFDEAQGKIFSLMHRDSYPRFLLTDVYKSLV